MADGISVYEDIGIKVAVWDTGSPEGFGFLLGLLSDFFDCGARKCFVADKNQRESFVQDGIGFFLWVQSFSPLRLDWLMIGKE